MQWLTREALKDADMLVNNQDADTAALGQKLTPEQMLLAPEALQQEMMSRGLMPQGNPPPMPQGGPQPMPQGVPNIPPEILQQILAGGSPPEPVPGMIPGGVNPNQLMAGDNPAAAGLNAVMSQNALPVTPGAGQGVNAPGGPGTLQPAAAQIGGNSPQTSPFGGMGLAAALARFGRPRGAGEAGVI
jgi:hypothetical protein